MKQLTLLSLAVLCAASSLPAATLYWDGADSTANPDGGTGTWDTATANWDDAATSGNAVAFSSGDDVVFGGTAGTVTVSSAITAGTVTFNAANYLINTNGNNMTWGGLLGTGSFSKRGTGTFTLNANPASSYSGNITVSNVAGGGSASGTLTVNGDQSGLSGGWGVAYGTINFSSGSSVSIASGKAVSVSFSGNGGSAGNAGTLNVSGTVSNAGTLNVWNNGYFRINSGANWTQIGVMSLAAGSGTTYGVNMTVSGGLFSYEGLSKISMNTTGGGSTLALNGGVFATKQGFLMATGGVANAAVNMNGGTLKLLGDVDQLANSTATGTGAFNFTLTGTGNTIDTNGFSTTLNRAVGGAGSLIKAGAGTLTLSGVNTYSGATTVNAGTLAVSGTVLVNGANGVTVATGATLAVTGTLKLTSASASISVADADAFTASGTLDLGGLFDAYAGATYQLISSGAGKVAAGSTLTVTGYNNAANVATFDATTGSLVFTAVPEPSTYGLMGAGALAVAAFVRRRRQRAR